MEPVKAPNLSLLKKVHAYKWVAFSMDKEKLIAVGETLRSLREKLGRTKAVVMRVLPADAGYAPTVR
jgi:hypothetical protein